MENNFEVTMHQLRWSFFKSKAMRLATTDAACIVFLMGPGGSDGCSWTTMAVDGDDDEAENDEGEEENETDVYGETAVVGSISISY